MAHRNGGVDAAARAGRTPIGQAVRSRPRRRRSARDVEKVFHGLDELGSWDAVIDGEPALARALSPSECDEALAAIARFVDLKSPYTLGHSPARRRRSPPAAGVELGLSDRATCRRCVAPAWSPASAGSGCRTRIWDKPGPLDRRRVGAGPDAPPAHRAHAAAVRPRSAPIGRVAVQHARAPRRLRLPARASTGRAIARAGPDARGRRRVPGRCASLARTEPALTADEAAAELRAEVRAGRHGRRRSSTPSSGPPATAPAAGARGPPD